MKDAEKVIWSNQIVDCINAIQNNSYAYYDSQFNSASTKEQQGNILREQAAVTSALNAVKYTVADAPLREYALSDIKGLIKKCKVGCYVEKARDENPERYAIFIKAMDYISEKISDVYEKF